MPCDGKPCGVQRRRAKGWRLPPNTICVDRSTPWGNIFVVGRDGTREHCVHLLAYLLDGNLCLSAGPSIEEQRAYLKFVKDHIKELEGKDLACWCPLDVLCHRDLYLRAANPSLEWPALPIPPLRPII